MIIERLDLLAFGRFSGESIDLSAGPTRFHLVYGPNESGKSTSLRAIHSLLFGIPVRSDDNYVHDYKSMRIGGRLRDSVSQAVVECVRRKGQQRTLLTQDESTEIDPAVIARMLPGIDAETFAKRFGLSHQELVRGGREITEGGGELGAILFAAGTGTGSLRAVQQELDKELRQLYIPRGSSGSLNRLLSEYLAAENRLRELRLLPFAYEQKRDDLERAKAEAEESTRRLTEESTRLRRLRAHKSALAFLPQRRAVLEELDQIGSSIPLLDEAFSVKRRDWEMQWLEANQRLTTWREQLTDLTTRREGLPIEPRWLEVASTVKGLTHDLGGMEAEESRIREWHLQLAPLETRIESARRAVTAAIAADQPSGRDATADGSLLADEPRLPDESIRSRIDELVTENGGLIEKLEAAKLAVESSRTKLHSIDERIASLPPPVDPTPLVEALANIGKPNSWIEPLVMAEQEWRTAERRVTAAVAKLGRFAGGAAEAQNLRPPPGHRIAELASQLDRAKRDVERAEADRLAEVARRDETCQQRIDEIGETEPPTSAERDAARNARDQTLERIREATLAGEPIGKTTVDTLAEQILAADRIGDALLAAHDLVVLRQRLDQEVRQAETRLTAADQRLADARGLLAAAEQAWLTLWSEIGVSAGDPETMRAWLSDHASLLEAIEQAAAKRTVAREARQRLDRCLVSLRVAWQLVTGATVSEPELGAEIEGVAATSVEVSQEDERNVAAEELIRLHAAATVRRDQWLRQVEEREGWVNQRDQLATELDRATSDLRRGERERARWQTRWIDLTRGLAGQDSPRPETVHGLIRQVDQWQRLTDARETLRRQIEQARGRLDAYLGRVRELATQLNESSTKTQSLQSSEPIREAAILVCAWAERVDRQTELRAEREALTAQLKTVGDRIRETQAEAESLRGSLARLCQEAGCERIEQLPEIERASKRRRELEHELRGIDQSLREFAGGDPLEEFIRAAEAHLDGDLDMAIATSDSTCQRLRDRWATQQQTLGKLQGEIDRLDGSGEAARVQQEQLHRQSGIRRQAERYAELTIALEALKLAIEDYRQRNEGPILGKASTFFSRVTGGEYEGLKVDFDDKDQPRLVAVRPAGLGRVAANQLSDGTADALYLALRLASLETHLDEHNPVPLIVDDCLIQFDDDRAAAALMILSELARRTQVILFTHHRHLLDLADVTLPANGFHVHELSK